MHVKRTLRNPNEREKSHSFRYHRPRLRLFVE